MSVDFICKMIAEMFGVPCNYSPIDEVVTDGDYCEKYCEKGSEEYELSDFCPSCGADMRGEERTKYVVCSQCAFWDYEKNCCSEWFRHKIPTGSLHRCADRRGEE